MKGAARPTSDMIRSRPVSRGTGGVSISRGAPDGEKKKPEEPAPLPVPPSAGDPVIGGTGAGDAGGAAGPSDAGVRVRAVIPVSGISVAVHRVVSAVDHARAIERIVIAGVANSPLPRLAAAVGAAMRAGPAGAGAEAVPAFVCGETPATTGVIAWAYVPTRSVLAEP
jgi:hypothetical protein